MSNMISQYDAAFSITDKLFQWDIENIAVCVTEATEFIVEPDEDNFRVHGIKTEFYAFKQQVLDYFNRVEKCAVVELFNELHATLIENNGGTLYLGGRDVR